MEAKKALVTGAAGFIGSHLTKKLLNDQWSVVGIDGFTDSYSPIEKRARAEVLKQSKSFELVEGHLCELEIQPLLKDVDVIFHLAGRAGVRPSFSLEERYYQDNVASTAALIDAVRASNVRRIVYASSSSVYGNDKTPFSEDRDTMPISPYGQSKLEAEKMVLKASDEIETTALRYFTVYGPEQRPDMGIRIFIEKALKDEPIQILGDGTQVRDFTYIDDIVTATVLAASAPCSSLAINVGGGSSVALKEVIDLIGQLIEKPIRVRYGDFARGDVYRTEADLTLASTALGFKPTVSIETGVSNEVNWLLSRNERLSHKEVTL